MKHEDLIRRYNTASSPDERDAAKEAVFEKYDNLVYVLSKRLSGEFWEKNRRDIYHEGVAGFCYALDRFDISSGNEFSTFLYFGIKKYVMDFCYTANIINISRAKQYGEELKLNGKDIYNCRDKNLIWMDAPKSTIHWLEGHRRHFVIDEGSVFDDIDRKLLFEKVDNIASKCLNDKQLAVYKRRIGGQTIHMDDGGKKLNCDYLIKGMDKRILSEFNRNKKWQEYKEKLKNKKHRIERCKKISLFLRKLNKRNADVVKWQTRQP